MNFLHLSLVSLAILYLPLGARAERPPQDRATAPIALKGTVEAIDERWDLERDYYQVSVRVEQVERGQAIQPGDLSVVSSVMASLIPRASYCGRYADML